MVRLVLLILVHMDALWANWIATMEYTGKPVHTVALGIRQKQTTPP
jgi:hypothetical protein